MLPTLAIVMILIPLILFRGLYKASKIIDKKKHISFINKLSKKYQNQKKHD